MFKWVEETFDTLAEYFLDLFVWFFEFVFGILNFLFEFLSEFASGLAVEGLEAAAKHVPEDLFDTILASYEWLRYIDGWVPVTYSLVLLVAFYALAIAMYIARFLISLIPFVDVKV